jgi:hypothetical protein
MRATILLSLLAAAGCANLTEKTLGVCGNDAVEAGEDCDSAGADGGLSCGAPGTAHACRYLCDHTAATSTCPTGWGCSRDGVCVFANGRFAEAPGSPIAGLSAGSLAFGDLDGDGALDLVNAQANGVSLRYGDGTGAFPGVGHQPLIEPFVPPPVAVGDVDHDGFGDLVMLDPLGFRVLRGQPDRTLPDVLFPTANVDFSSTSRLVAVRTDPASPFQTVLRFAGAGGTSKVSWVIDGNVWPLSTVVPGDIGQLAGDITVGDIDRTPTVDGEEVILGMQGAGEILIYTTAPGDPPTFSLRETVPVPGFLDWGVYLADVDGDGNQDLVAGTILDTSYVFYGDGAGGFAPGVEDDRYSEVLAIADLNGDGRPDVVSAFGIGIARGSSIDYTTSTPIQRPLGFGDLNGDGVKDVVSWNGGSPEIFLGSSIGYFSEVQTEALGVGLLAVGDYDGDRIDDLAVLAAVDAQTDHLEVLFGRSDHPPSDAVVMADVAHVTALTTSLLENNGHEDATSDLAMESLGFTPAMMPADWLTFVYGDSNRRLDAPLRGKVWQALVGHFLATSHDLLDVATVWPGFQVYAGAPNAELDSLDLPPNWPDGALWQNQDTQPLGFVVADVNADGIDDLVTSTTNGALLETALFSGTQDTPPTFVHTVAPVSSNLPPRLVDLDGDGALDVLQWRNEIPSSVYVWTFWGDRSGAFDVTTTPGFGIDNVVSDVTAIRLGPSRLPSLAVRTDAGIRFYDYSGDRATGFTLDPLFIPMQQAGGIVARDVNGDGLDDLLVDGPRGLHVLLAQTQLQ